MSDEKNIIPVEKLLPPVLNVIPLAGRPIFPGVFTPMAITDAEDVTAINSAYEENGFIGFVLLKNDNEKLEDFKSKVFLNVQTLQNRKSFK